MIVNCLTLHVCKELLRCFKFLCRPSGLFALVLSFPLMGRAMLHFQNYSQNCCFAFDPSVTVVLFFDLVPSHRSVAESSCRNFPASPQSCYYKMLKTHLTVLNGMCLEPKVPCTTWFQVSQEVLFIFGASQDYTLSMFQLVQTRLFSFGLVNNYLINFNWPTVQFLLCIDPKCTLTE